jgi:glycerophosphoryl diester phosphodiesterase
MVGAEAIHPNFHCIDDKGLVGRVKDAGIMINTYTVNDEKTMRRFLDYKVDGIITNYPDKLKKIMEE